MFTKLTASAAAILLSTGAAFAQEADTQAAGDEADQSFDVVFIDVGGAAVQVPLALAAQACALATEEIQQMAQMRLDEQGLMPSDVGITPTASADASVGATTETDAASTTQTADANATTDMGNATTAATQTAEAGATGDAAASEGTTEMAASGDASATGTGEVENVESTAAETTAAAGDTSADPDQAQDPFLVLAVCTIEPAQAASLNIDTTQTGETLGLDASRLQPADNQ